ncbi:hypothetical protein EOPP23_04825 [Endozoicomonas sp. OPT23]|uniref:hypothetical protein n=1 Tax=Endozoicomonas sp. OPT23 TaxID=2072845 RepID=UPI00129BA05E|nr:hypothetical protein [Endozoicomonas sp. OPT23]MRI32318.1 hypothetical protein [Endozoicomonas sp. OPT23]
MLSSSLQPARHHNNPLSEDSSSSPEDDKQTSEPALNLQRKPIQACDQKRLRTFQISITTSAPRPASPQRINNIYQNAAEDTEEATIQGNLRKLEQRLIPESWVTQNKTINPLPSKPFKTLTPMAAGYQTLIRRHFMMYGLIDKEWVNKLSGELLKLGIRSCLEIGAGNGWLAQALTETGIKMYPTDLKLYPECNYTTGFSVEQLSAVEAIDKYQHLTQALVMSWPDRHNSGLIDQWPEDQWIIYIGEGPLGKMTACFRFFEQFKTLSVIETPNWSGEHAVCLIGKKSFSGGDYYLDSMGYKRNNNFIQLHPTLASQKHFMPVADRFQTKIHP